MIRVVVVDDDARFRDALAAVLESDGRFEVVGSAASADEAVEVVARTAPTCVLLDVRMPGGGPAAARSITLGARDPEGPDHPGPVVVAISADAGVQTITDMLRAGATGFLVKGGIGNTLTDLVVRCTGGEVVLAAPGASQALSRLLADSGPSTA